MIVILYFLLKLNYFIFRHYHVYCFLMTFLSVDIEEQVVLNEKIMDDGMCFTAVVCVF